MAVTWKKVDKNIYQSEEDPRKFRVDLYYGRDERGRTKKTKKVLKDANLTEARNFLRIHEADRAKKIAQKPQRVSLQELFENWNKYVGDVRNAETTQASTRNIQRHILEYFGDVNVGRITTASVRKYLAYLRAEKKLSSKTANKHRTHLHTLFDYMISEEEVYGIYRNPIDSIKPFSEEEFNHEVYAPEEARDLLVALRRSGRYDLEIAVNIAFWCACRREEVCALDWDNVDLAKREIKICEVRTTAGGKVVERKTTKNKEIRMVGIPDWFYHCLVRLKGHQDEMKRLLGSEYYGSKDFVFCHDDGRPWHPNALSNQYKDYLEKNGFRHIRFHDLRHTNLSMLMTKMSAVDVAKIGGHKQVSTTTDVYGHSFSGVTGRGVDTMNEIMSSMADQS